MRAFLALDIPERVKTYLKNVTEALSRKEEGVRWVKSENQHLTLKFFGEIEEESKEKIISIMEKIAPSVEAVKLSLKGIEGFPKNHMARVIVITLSDGVEELKKMFRRLESELVKLGFREEDREFIPHITLGRRKNAKPIKEFVPIEPLEFTVDDLVLYKSTLTREGPIYEPIWKSKLKERGR